MSLAKVTFIIFDCDNTLVQSEPIGFQVSAEITNEILALRGIDDVRFTGPQLQREFVGMTFQNMVCTFRVPGAIMPPWPGRATSGTCLTSYLHFANTAITLLQDARHPGKV